MNTDYNAERRCRYRLAKHGLRLHKICNKQGDNYFAIFNDGENIRGILDDSYRKLDSVIEYCSKLELREREYRDRHKC